MKVLLGTTNSSKIIRFSDLLKNTGVEFITLKDICVKDEPEETGSTPEENARIKASFYSKYANRVICNDSGLYFKNIAIDDKRQPGLNVRTPMGLKRLTDEEMIDYYSSLIKSLGGRVEAYYLDGIAVYCRGKLFSFMDKESSQKKSFTMIDKASDKRFPGWPLDSLSLNEKGEYFVSAKVEKSKENIIKGDYEKRVVDFLKGALEITG